LEKGNIMTEFETLAVHLEVVRHTDKAVALDNPAFAEAAEAYAFGGVNELAKRVSSAAREAYMAGHKYIWLPRSQVTLTENGKVSHIAGWLAKKSEITTVESLEKSQKAFIDGCAKHDALIEKARAMGVKGITQRTRSSTILAKISEFEKAKNEA
jgi:hypothetical protein